MTCDEIISLEIEEPYSFFIKNNSSVYSNLKPEKIDDQDMLDYFDDNLKLWIKKSKNGCINNY